MLGSSDSLRPPPRTEPYTDFRNTTLWSQEWTAFMLFLLNSQ